MKYHGDLLYVAVGPQFPDDHSRIAYTWAGVSRNISCSPLAEPPATVEWMRFGQKIVNNNATYHIISTTNASHLQVLLLGFVFFGPRRVLRGPHCPLSVNVVLSLLVLVLLGVFVTLRLYITQSYHFLPYMLFTQTYTL